MTIKTKSKSGGSRPNAGGRREGSGRKSVGGVVRSAYITVRVEPEIADWLKLNGGSAKHYELLRRAVADFQGAEDALLGERAQAAEESGKVSQEEAATMVEDLTLSHNP